MLRGLSLAQVQEAEHMPKAILVDQGFGGQGCGQNVVFTHYD